ncbi:MAG: hypothetical protein IPJ00_13035 [Saprospirales bacterium]|nr:hypothetical protein [Saprospirales bacterium]
MLSIFGILERQEYQPCLARRSTALPTNTMPQTITRYPDGLKKPKN